MQHIRKDIRIREYTSGTKFRYNWEHSRHQVVMYDISFRCSSHPSLLEIYTVRLPSLQICFTLGNRNDRPSLLEDADSEKYSTVTSLPTCHQLVTASSTHDQFWVLPELYTLVGRETTPNRYPYAFMFDPDIRHGIIFPIHPIHSQPHPGILDVDNSIFGILPFLEFSNIAPSRQLYPDVRLTI